MHGLSRIILIEEKESVLGGGCCQRIRHAIIVIRDEVKYSIDDVKLKMEVEGEEEGGGGFDLG